MSLTLGGWGAGRWGSTFVWGWQLAGIVCTAQVIGSDIVAAMEQTTPTTLVPSTSITLDGTDVTSNIARCKITLQGNGASSLAEVSFLNTSTTPTIHVSVLSISITYTLPTGAVYTVERFRGIVRRVETDTQLGRAAQTWTAFDQAYVLSEIQNTAFGYNVYSVAAGISALTFINTALAAAGLGAVGGTFDDYVPYLVIPIRYGSVMSMILALTNGISVVFFFARPDGRLVLSEYDTPISTPFSFPLTCQTEQAPIDDDDRYNQCAVYISAGLAFATYNDTALQATQGVLRKHVANQLINTSAQALAKGQAEVDNSQARKYTWKTPLNPFVFPGDTSTFTLADSTPASVRVEKVVDTMEWPGGFWSTWEGRVSS